MKLSELKAKVYRMAGVNTTSELKKLYPELKPWDMRRKDSWQQAYLYIYSLPRPESEQMPEPLEEFLAEIDAFLAKPRVSLTSRLDKLAQQLETIAQDYSDEATYLETVLKTKDKPSIAKRRRRTRH